MRSGLYLVMALCMLAFRPPITLAQDPLGDKESDLIGTSINQPPGQISNGTDVYSSAVYTKMPMRFEATQGQTNAGKEFVSRNNGFTLFVAPADIEFVTSGLVPPDGRSVGNAHSNWASAEQMSVPSASVVSMRLVGASSKSKIEGLEKFPRVTNYFIGNDQQKWRTQIATYSKLRQKEVYPGVDLVLFGRQQELEYDFVIAPGADPTVIALAFEGAERLEIDPEGDLIASVRGSQIRERKPVMYQNIGGTRKPVLGRYVLKGRFRVGFQVGEYDSSTPLVIDPTVVFSTYFGGFGGEGGRGVTLDAAGNIYLVGFADTNFPATPGAVQTRYSGLIDTFVAKFNAQGRLVYATYLGGTGDDVGTGIAVDGTGNAYVTGWTTSIDFPTTTGAYLRSFGGLMNAFVTIVNPTGTALLYSTYIGASSVEAWGIAIDSAGSAYVTGYATTNLPTTPGAFQRGFRGSFGSAFVTKLNPGGTALVYSTYLGGNFDEWGFAITVDRTGAAYVTGISASPDFPTTPGAFDVTPGRSKAFVTKFDPGGSTLVYSTLLGGSCCDDGRAIFVDTAGVAYVTGETGSTDFPTTLGAFQSTMGAGIWDAYVSKLNPTGTGLLYSTYLGGRGREEGNGVVADSVGNIYVSGWTLDLGSGNDFPVTGNALQPTYGGGFCSQPGINQFGPIPDPRLFEGCGDAFVSKFSPTGALIYSSYLGGNGDDGSTSITLDGAGNAYVVGFTFSPNFPVTPNAFQPNFAGGLSDIFLSKFSFGASNLSVNITASPQDPILGDELTYTVTIANSGPDTATGVSLTDSLPQGVNVASVSTSQGTCTQSNLVLSCLLGNLPSGNNIEVTIVVIPTTTGTITNTATVRGNEADPITANNTMALTNQVALQYAVKFICGKSPGTMLAPGSYFTAINLHNPIHRAILLRKKFAIAISEDQPGPVSPFFEAKVGPDEAIEIDCPDILRKLQSSADFLEGFAVLQTAVEVDVVAAYTATSTTGQVETLYTERVYPLSRSATQSAASHASPPQ